MRVKSKFEGFVSVKNAIAFPQKTPVFTQFSFETHATAHLSIALAKQP